MTQLAHSELLNSFSPFEYEFAVCALLLNLAIYVRTLFHIFKRGIYYAIAFRLKKLPLLNSVLPMCN